MRSLTLAEDEVVDVILHSENIVEVATEHPYVTQTPGICGGSAVIKGIRIPVRVLVGYYQMGVAVDEILSGYPRLTRAQFFDALSYYYYDHQVEITAEQTAHELDHLMQKFDLEMSPDGVLTPRGKISPQPTQTP